MAPDMPQAGDMRRPWPEGRDVSGISRMAGRDRETAGRCPQAGGFSPEAPAPSARGCVR